MACLISSLENNESTRGILVSFQNGTLEDSAENQFENKLLTNGKKVIAFSKSKSMLYKGDVTRNDLSNEFIVIINRKTNKARFVAVDNCSFAPLIPSETADNLNCSKDKNWNASTIMLNKTFGSKRAQRAGEQMERLNQEVSKVKDDLEKTVRETEIEDIPAADIVGTCNPPINKDATTVDGVYEINNIVAKDVLDTLKGASKVLLSNGPEEILTFEFAVKLFYKVKASSINSKNKGKKCRIIILLDTLMKLATAKYNAIATKSFKVCSLSERINQYALDTFTINTSKGRTRPISMRDKTICYIIVLAVLINDFSISLNELSQAFGVAQKRIQDFCRILSLTINKNKADADLILPLPKNVIVPRLSRKRKQNVT